MTLLTIIGRFSICLGLNGVYLITCETYPTIIRATMMSFFSFFGYMAGCVASQVAFDVSIQILNRFQLFLFVIIFLLYLKTVWSLSAPLICGVCSILASLLAHLQIPETKDHVLLDTFNEQNDKFFDKKLIFQNLNSNKNLFFINLI